MSRGDSPPRFRGTERPHSVAVTMMDIGKMRVAVPDGHVPVAVNMRLARRRARQVLMLMVLVMPVQVLVLHGLVDMLVLVALAGVEPDPERHQRSGSK